LVLAALTLAKLGLPQDPALLDAIQLLLHRRPSSAESPAESAEAFAVSPGQKLATQLQEAVKTILAGTETANAAESPPSPADLSSAGADGRGTADQGGAQADSGQLGRWVLNAQTGGSVAHRVGTLPLLIAGKLVEVDVALFEQDARQSKQGEPRSRHLVFVLNTETLGGVEVSARLVNSHVRIRFSSDRAATVELLASRREELARHLATLGWTIDELEYEMKTGDERNAAYDAVVGHVVAQGSLDRKV
jgi:hypothetical protein